MTNLPLTSSIRAVYPNPSQARSFWRDALDLRRSISLAVAPKIALFGALAAGVSGAYHFFPWPEVGVSHIEYTGALLVLLLVFRTNTGYDRWWEARKLWGGIVNQSRNLALKGITFTQEDAAWRDTFVRHVAAFAHVARRSLRGEREAPELDGLLGPDVAAAVVKADHMPGHVAGLLGAMLSAARRRGSLDGYAFLETDRERAILIDHIGGCERILKTPMPLIHAIKIRRFILLYLIAVPFVLVTVAGQLTPFVTVLIAYPLLAIEQMGQELENPFEQSRFSHLPIDDICATIERNVIAYAAELAPAERGS